MSATDGDRGSFGTIAYTLGSTSGGTFPITINKETGQLCTSTALDRDEGLDKFDLTVTATDGVRHVYILLLYIYSIKITIILYLKTCKHCLLQRWSATYFFC